MTSSITKRLLAVLYSSIISLSLSTLVLLNTPDYYSLNRLDSIKATLFSLISFFLITYYFLEKLILPFYKTYRNGQNLLFILIISLVLFGSIFFLSPYYWMNPEAHPTEICYYSDSFQKGQYLRVNEIRDKLTNRLFPPESLGFANYPIYIKSDNCIRGALIALVNNNEIWSGADVIYFAKSPDAVVEKSILKKVDGIAGQTVMFQILKSNWFNFAKLIALAMSSIYLASILFGLSEMMTTDNQE